MRFAFERKAGILAMITVIQRHFFHLLISLEFRLHFIFSLWYKGACE